MDIAQSLWLLVLFVEVKINEPIRCFPVSVTKKILNVQL